MSGLPTRRFVFEAFLPKDKKERAMVLSSLEQETRTIIIYEAPHHLIKTLEELYQVLGERSITLCRELTKKYETIFSTTISSAISYYKEQEPRGEFVLVIQGKSQQQILEEQRQIWVSTSLEEHMQHYESQGISRKEAMKLVAKDRGIPKREVYGKLLERI